LIYSHVTIKITLWRKQFRAETNKHDNEFHDRATDSLINYETVKYFNAEQYEADRYCGAVGNYQKYSINVQYSLSLLNIAQQLLMQGTLCAAMIIMIYSSDDVGAFVAVQAYLIQLFTPLNFLGAPLTHPLLLHKSIAELMGPRSSPA
jgi:ABC-type transport system involved in Fe-S cluster assembly fused permease/ATPase subunit